MSTPPNAKQATRELSDAADDAIERHEDISAEEMGLITFGVLRMAAQVAVQDMEKAKKDLVGKLALEFLRDVATKHGVDVASAAGLAIGASNFGVLIRGKELFAAAKKDADAMGADEASKWFMKP